MWCSATRLPRGADKTARPMLRSASFRVGTRGVAPTVEGVDVEPKRILADCFRRVRGAAQDIGDGCKPISLEDAPVLVGLLFPANLEGLARRAHDVDNFDGDWPHSDLVEGACIAGIVVERPSSPSCHVIEGVTFGSPRTRFARARVPRGAAERLVAERQRAASRARAALRQLQETPDTAVTSREARRRVAEAEQNLRDAEDDLADAERQRTHRRACVGNLLTRHVFVSISAPVFC